MKYLLISLLAIVSCSSVKAQTKNDTTYMLVGYNCTQQDGGIRDGNRGIKFIGKFLSAKQIEDPIIKAYNLKRVIILSIYIFKNKSEWDIFWSKSNSEIQ